MSMTESEAIERMKYRIATAKEAVGSGADGKAFEDMEMAIEALEEIQQYRAIGTVEEVKALKDDFWKLNEMCREYSALGTVEELKAIKQWKSDIIESFSKYDVNSVDELMKRFRELTEKAEPKKPYIQQVEIDFYEHDCMECPSCDSFLGYASDCKDEHYQDNYCPHCGQRLDWE
jgi:hypothetical protein